MDSIHSADEWALQDFKRKYRNYNNPIYAIWALEIVCDNRDVPSWLRNYIENVVNELNLLQNAAYRSKRRITNADVAKAFGFNNMSIFRKINADIDNNIIFMHVKKLVRMGYRVTSAIRESAIKYNRDYESVKKYYYMKSNEDAHEFIECDLDMLPRKNIKPRQIVIRTDNPDLIGKTVRFRFSHHERLIFGKEKKS